jgi:hypothetical protein
MPRIRCFMLSLLCFACAKPAPEPAQEWKLSAPKYLIPATGESRPFDQFKDQDLRTLQLDDVIVFNEGPDPRLQLTVTSECSVGLVKSRLSVRDTLPAQISVFQILPPQAWIPSSAGMPICSIHFEVKEDSGSLHYFDLDTVPLSLSRQMPQLKMDYDGDLTSDTDPVLFRSSGQNHFIRSQAGRTYEQVCTDGMVSIPAFGNSLSLADFESTASGQRCLFVERLKSGLAVAYSPVFRIFSHMPTLDVEILSGRLPLNLSAPKLPLHSWSLFNHGDQSITVALPKIDLAQLRLDVVYRAHRTVVSRLNIPISWARPKDEKGFALLTIQPHRRIQLNLYLSGRLNCGTHAPYGLKVRAPEGAFLEAIVLQDKTKPVESANSVAAVKLPLLPSRWIGENTEAAGEISNMSMCKVVGTL